MGFWDDRAEQGDRPTGITWVGTKEKNELIASGAVWNIISVQHGKGKFGDEYTITFTVDDETDLCGHSFPSGKVQSRDRFFEDVQDALNNGEESVPAVLKLDDRSQVFGPPVAA